MQTLLLLAWEDCVVANQEDCLQAINTVTYIFSWLFFLVFYSRQYTYFLTTGVLHARDYSESNMTGGLEHKFPAQKICSWPISGVLTVMT